MCACCLGQLKMPYLPSAADNRGGAVNKCLEKWALESECVGGQSNLQADSFVAGTNVSTLTAAHLAGKQVVVGQMGLTEGCSRYRLAGWSP